MAKPPVVGIHLDLKYIMPRKTYLLEWARRLPGYGINTLLIEYEDKFPYQKHGFLRDETAFTPDELRRFLSAARGVGLRVIPLVQTLSHLEFALDHDEFASFREAPDIPTQICPSNPAAVAFVKDLIAEVMAFHNEDEFFHLGGDETWFLGTCPRCKAWVERDGPIQAWTDHEGGIIRQVLDAGKRPIVWDDIFWRDFEAIRRTGLPKQTVLHAWNYNITSLKPTGRDSTDAEFGGAADVLKQIEVYRDAGYDSIAGPCLNYGNLFPRVEGSLANTAVWAQKVRHAGMLGMINTAWACFHIPLPPQNMLVAATGALCADPDVSVGEEWQARFVEDEFGFPAAAVPRALGALGELWEIPIEGAQRPFTPVVYCYMNMVLHYTGGQAERRRRGAYPNDWGTVDFNAMYRKGVDLTRRSANVEAVIRETDRRLAAYRQAAAVMRDLARAAARLRDEAEMLAVFADTKLLSARVFSHLLRADGDAVALLRDVTALRPRLVHAMMPFMETHSVERMMRAWVDPLAAALAQGTPPSM